MFGYLVANIEILTKQQRQDYRSFYCGLCRQLSKDYGVIGRMTLTYDFTFVNMVLDGVYQCNDQKVDSHCPLHPISKHSEIINDFSAYCADMNIYLSYFKYVDDVLDENSQKAKRRKEKLEPYIRDIENRYPALSSVIKQQLSLISQTENDNILDPFVGANQFGEIMAQLMAAGKEDEHTDLLKAFGFHIGRFIYLMDAVLDLKDDIKNCCYNPLIQIDSKQFESLLTNVMEEVDRAYIQLNICQNKDLIDNIIYSGIWSRYQLYKKKTNKKKKGASS